MPSNLLTRSIMFEAGHLITNQFNSFSILKRLVVLIIIVLCASKQAESSNFCPRPLHKNDICPETFSIVDEYDKPETEWKIDIDVRFDFLSRLILFHVEISKLTFYY